MIPDAAARGKVRHEVGTAYERENSDTMRIYLDDCVTRGRKVDRIGVKRCVLQKRVMCADRYVMRVAR